MATKRRQTERRLYPTVTYLTLLSVFFCEENFLLYVASNPSYCPILFSRAYLGLILFYSFLHLFPSTLLVFLFILLFCFFLSIKLSAPSVSSTIFAKLLSFFLTFPPSFMYFFTSVFLLPFYWILFALQPSFCWIPCSYGIVACTAVCSAMTAR